MPAADLIFLHYSADRANGLAPVSAHGADGGRTQRKKRQRIGLRDSEYVAWGRTVPLPRVVPIPGIAIPATPILDSPGSSSAAAFTRSIIIITLGGPGIGKPGRTAWTAVIRIRIITARCRHTAAVATLSRTGGGSVTATPRSTSACPTATPSAGSPTQDRAATPSTPGGD